MLTGVFRASYTYVFQPQVPKDGGEPKYSVTMLIPKSDVATYQAVQAEINQALQAGVQKAFNGQMPSKPMLPIHDGDGTRKDGDPFGEECRGCWVFTSSSKQTPFVVDAQVQPIIDPTQVYSGMWANVNVTFFAYNNAGKKGIGCGLNGVQKIRDDTPLSSRVTAQEAFQVIPAPQPAAPAATQTPAYSASAAPASYPAPAVDPITGQPLPQGRYISTGFPVMGV